MVSRIKGVKPLDAQCILILGGCRNAVKSIASLLATNGAIVFISGADDVTLHADLAYIRQQVPGCSVSGTIANVKSAASIAEFVLTAEIALPIHDALIYFPDESIASDEFLIAADRLFTLMANHRNGIIINIGKSTTLLTKPVTVLTELSANLRKILEPRGIQIAEMEVESSCVSNECLVGTRNRDLQKAYSDDYANTVLQLLCQRQFFPKASNCRKNNSKNI
jgi:hypothetical protein